jgi:two-component system, cell cycle response regulator
MAGGKKKIRRKTVRVLMIEANETDVRLISRMLAREKSTFFQVTRVATLAEGIEKLRARKFDAVLMDISLPDAEGLAGCRAIKKQVPSIPLLIVAEHADEKLAIQAVKEGAQDYFVRGEKDPGKLLLLAIHHAITRERLLDDLRNLSMTDELTGLYNRRGFLAFGLEHLKLAKRTGRAYTLVYIDVDGLKTVNDTLGHEMGDRLLVEAAEVLRQTFRISDICARIGGDEFAVIAVESPETTTPIFRRRLQKALDDFNRRKKFPVPLSLSSGMASSSQKNITDVEELLRRADRSLYEHKRSKIKAARAVSRS